jgi:hypothetical protein
MNFDGLPEFNKDCKNLGKRYRSLPQDIARFKKILEAIPLGTDKHFAILIENESIKIAKARFFCQSLMRNSLRIIYAYDEKSTKIVFIELYYKGEQERENQQRIRNYLKSLGL